MPKSVFGVVLYLLFGFCGVLLSVSQENSAGEAGPDRASIPEELLRPQRGEAPRYPVDTVIGPLGRGEASEDAYLFARKVSAALRAGNQRDPSLQGMNSVSLEAFISELNGISPGVFRLGSGREEPDGAVSFLVRFLGRERGITGELYIRPQGFEPAEDAPPPQPAGTAEEAALSGEPERAGDLPPADEAVPAAGEAAETDRTVEAADAPAPADPAGTAPAGTASIEAVPAGAGQAENRPLPGPVVWIFEDLILEEARERETEEPAARFDFPPYERFF
jgi:hypothetical protein